MSADLPLLPPAGDEPYIVGELDPSIGSFEDLMDALRDRGAEVERFIIGEDGVAVPVAND